MTTEITSPITTEPTPSVVRLPGVYRPQRDTWLLADAVSRELAWPSPGRRRVLELAAGSGVASATAATVPGVEVTAVDVSRRALLGLWLTGRRHGARVTVRRGDLCAPVAGEHFDLVVANPPYVPAPTDRLPRRGHLRACDGGRDGRAVLDRVCDQSPHVLGPGGAVLIVHSALCGVAATLERLAGHGLVAEVVARGRLPFGPVLTARTALLEERGLIAPGESVEELVVIRGRRTDPGTPE